MLFSFTCLPPFRFVLFMLLLLLLLHSHRSPSRAKCYEKSGCRLTTHRRNSMQNLSVYVYNITCHFLSSTPFRSQRQNLNQFIFSNIRNRNQNQCVCMWTDWEKEKKEEETNRIETAVWVRMCFDANHFQIFSFVGVEPVVSCFGITVLCGFWHTKHAHQSCLRATIVCRYIIFGERIIFFFRRFKLSLKLY